MSIQKYLESSPLSELIRYRSEARFQENGVAYTGSPRQHPYDREKLILVIEPFSRETTLLEFRLKDVLHVEELASLGTEKGESAEMVRIWIRKASRGLRYSPFTVA